MPQSSKASEVFPFLYLGAEGDLTEQGKFYEIRKSREIGNLEHIYRFGKFDIR